MRDSQNKPSYIQMGCLNEFSPTQEVVMSFLIYIIQFEKTSSCHRLRRDSTESNFNVGIGLA